MKLPCTVDSEVWYVDAYGDIYTDIVRGVVDGYLWYRTCGFALNVVWDKPIMGHFGYKRKEMPFSEIGKTVFLTKEEAEAALKAIEENESFESQRLFSKACSYDNAIQIAKSVQIAKGGNT